MRLFTPLLFLVFAWPVVAQVTISGKVSDADSGETVIGATVQAPAQGLGTITNEYGFYSLRLPADQDSVTLVYSYIGFNDVQRRVGTTADRTLDVELGGGVELAVVEISANSFEEQLNSTEMSVERIDPVEAKIIPVLLGESDILKVIQLKPGIPSGGEGTTGLYVRGGGQDQNLFILDEAVVYNPNHLFGFFSTFNTDAVKDLKIYKGGFPAQYGGRLSSVVDVKLKEGNKKHFSGTGGIGLIASRLTLEGPIQQDKSSFIVSGRRTYFDLITRQVNRANEDNEDFSPIPDYFFYDLNTKVNFQLGERDRLYLSGYFGRDEFGFEGDFFSFAFNWGNATGTARWNHTFNPRLFANTTFTYSDYQYNINNELTGFQFGLGSDIRDSNLKTDFYYAANNRHTLRFGGGVTFHQFTVGRLSGGSDDGTVSFSAGQEFSGTELGLYAGDEWDATELLRVNYGLRLSGFVNDGEFKGNVEPRVSARYLLNDRMTLKGSYARMSQYLHLITNSGIALPTDVWYPTTTRVDPQISDQVALGYSLLLGKDDYFLTNEIYYKNLQNQIDFIDGADLFANDDLEEEFAIGRGYAYGMELGIERKKGRLTGWIGYTLAWVRRGEFEPVVQDDPLKVFGEGSGYFAPRYDRRHDVSVVALYKLGERWTVSAAWVYGSGDLTWLPTGRFLVQDAIGNDFQSVVPDYQQRNNIRLAPYHRLDLSAVWQLRPRGKNEGWESDITFSVVNAYDRRNAFFVYLEPEFREVDTGSTVVEVPERVAAKQVSLFPVLPAITYNFKF